MSQAAAANKPGNKELREALQPFRQHIRRLMWIGLICSLLSLMPSLYMLEVYDRVVNSRSGLTLAMLTLLALGVYVVLEMLEWVRSEIMHHAGLHFNDGVCQRVFNAIFEAGLRQGRSSPQALSDLRTVRDFLSSPALMAVMDAPFSLIYLAIVFAIHPVLGVVTLLAMLAQVILTYQAEKKTQPPLAQANVAAIGAQTYAGTVLRNAQVIESMGMIRSIYGRWMDKQREMLGKQAIASDHAGLSSALSKLNQQVLTSGLLGLGCYFMLQNTLNGGAGMMIVASIIGGKAMTPFVQVVMQWKSVVNARDAYGRLDKLLTGLPEREKGMPLPRPTGLLAVESVVAGAPGSQQAILRGVNFVLPAGEALAVVGPSASGKTSLARLLVGIWPALSGKVRLDGADVFTWNKMELGPSIGYLPQGIELFDGTLAENIARFGEVDREKVQEAIDLVGLGEMVAALPEGMDSRIGDEGAFLSGGQRQRVGLARAIYGNPAFVVLDEPNSSLDEAGERALLHTLQTLKSRRTTLVVITHRTNVLGVVDKMLVLRDGAVQLFGPRDEVLAALSGKPAAPAPAAVAAAPAPTPAA